MASGRNDFLKNILSQNQGGQPNREFQGAGGMQTPQRTISAADMQMDSVNPLQQRAEAITAVRKLVADQFQSQLIDKNKKDDPQFQETVKNFIKIALARQPQLTNHMQMQMQLQQTIFDDIMGFGPIQSLLDDPTVTEIMVSHYNKIYVEQKGKMILVPEVTFESEAELQNTIQKIVMPMSGKIDDAEPIVDTSLPNGSRVNATFPPASPHGATLTIRKFSEQKLTPDDYLNFNSLDQRMIDFLKFAVMGKCNIIVAGGTGTGKTTLLNMISRFIPDHEAIVTVEDTLELQLQQDNVRSMLARKPVNGKGELTIRDLVKNTLRQRPDRIVVGEIRGGEIYDMLDSMSSGHEGGMGTIHTKGPKHLVSIRIPVLMGMSDISMDEESRRKMIADSLDLIVYIKRYRDGRRVITHLTEVVGIGEEGASRLKLKSADPNKIYLKDIFKFEEKGYLDGKLQGNFVACNHVPRRITEKAAIYNSYIDEKIFFEDNKIQTQENNI